MERRAVSPVIGIAPYIVGALVLLGLSFISFHNYLLFHSLAEMFSIVVACGIFMLFWNTRRFLDNGFYLLIGIAYLFVAGIDMIHTLAYIGMGVFPGYDTNLPTQLWIAARYVESLSLLAASLLIRRKLKSGPVFIGYAIVVSLLLGSIFYWNVFPDCFFEGVGLTLFKKVSEYIISLILLVSVALLYRERDEFDEDVFRLLVAAIVVTIASELCFTLYIHAYGLPNLIGHLLKIVSFYLIYKALIQAGLTRPYDLLFRNLKRSEESLRESDQKYRGLFDHSLSGVGLHEIVLDAQGQPVDYVFLEVNPAFEELTGLSTDKIIGKRVTEVLPGIEDTPFTEEYGRVALTGEPARFEQNAPQLDRHYAIAAFSPRQGQFATVFDDITERVQAEEQIKASLREKEVLLQEIHHRVKNNLAVVSSLLEWQSGLLEDKQARAALQECQDRVRSMARVHEHLYRSPNLAQIGMAEYIEELVDYLGHSYSLYGATLTTDATGVTLDLDRALPCGLIINELVSNCLKHAFRAGQPGEIRVTMYPLPMGEGKVELTVSDNGAGLPDHLDIDTLDSLGLSLVRLLTRQLDGTLEVDRSEGTTFKIMFPVPDHTGVQEE